MIRDLLLILLPVAVANAQYPLDYAYRGAFDDPTDNHACRYMYPVSLRCPSNIAVDVDGSYATDINCGGQSAASIGDPASTTYLRCGVNIQRVALEIKDLSLLADPITITNPQTGQRELPSGTIPLPGIGAGSVPYVLNCRLIVVQTSHLPIYPSPAALTFNFYHTQHMSATYEGILTLDGSEYPIQFAVQFTFPAVNNGQGKIYQSGYPASLQVYYPWVNADVTTGPVQVIHHNGHSFALRVSFFRLDCCGGYYNMVPTLQGDLNGDGAIDRNDLTEFSFCRAGASRSYPLGCYAADYDGDNDVDMNDFGLLQRLYQP